MNVFDRSINIDALFKFSQMYISFHQVHLKNVYSSLAVCMFVAAAGSYVHVVTRLFQGGVLSVLGSLGLMFWLAMTPTTLNREEETGYPRRICLPHSVYSPGVGLGPTLDLTYYLFVLVSSPQYHWTAFMGTSVIFICFTLSALYAKRRTYLFLGGNCAISVSENAHMYLGLLIMCGFVLFDTQLIIEKAENGDKDYVWHCVDLFLDFITIFRKLMVILAMNDKDKKKEKK
uniref:Transmembrane BAX inhibitor motif containing 6 n=1 Tax=Maylandia zebra TaxID=106582 RepID=A0A3P9DAJ6_9CICH